ncbi:3-oxoacyl-ACP synthase [Corallibacter sp.]|uniref:3-oxoacyl-ACP synthase n=1 Tax=Corallibacter sp. TaxID=2038084 RepID=UPI003AB83F27
MTVKQTLHIKSLEVIESQIATILNVIKGIQEALLSETKSSAGDKHETGRAMLQLEREKAGNQLANAENLKHVLYKIDTSSHSKIIGLGSVVFTSQNHYFIAISIGKLTAEADNFYAISPTTPIGKLLMGKTEGDIIVFNNQKIKIDQVL